jgi:hypothetical protein
MLVAPAAAVTLTAVSSDAYFRVAWLMERRECAVTVGVR